METHSFLHQSFNWVARVSGGRGRGEGTVLWGRHNLHGTVVVHHKHSRAVRYYHHLLYIFPGAGLARTLYEENKWVEIGGGGSVNTEVQSYVAPVAFASVDRTSSSPPHRSLEKRAIYAFSLCHLTIPWAPFSSESRRALLIQEMTCSALLIHSKY